jgi:hypothetical protein
MDSFWVTTPHPRNLLEGIAAYSHWVRRQGSCGGWVTILISLGRNRDSGFLRGNWGCLRGIPFFRSVFTNHGQGLSTCLTLFHPLGMFSEEKQRLHIGDFCPFVLPLAKLI